MKRQLCLAVASVAAAALLMAQAQAVVLYSDSFNRVEGSGDTNGKPADPANFSAWGTNDNAFGGALSNAWRVGPSRGGGANQATDGDLASTIEGGAQYPVDITGSAANGFSVRFRFNRFHPINPGTGNGFVAVGLGADPNATVGGGGFVPNNSDLAVIFQQGVGGNQGNTQILQDNTFVDPNNGSQPDSVDYGDPTAWHNVFLKVVPATPGAYGDADTINGTLSVDGAPGFNFSVQGGDFFGTLSFSSNGFVHRAYDNVIVRAIPEPTSCLLLAAGGMALLVRRRS